MSDTPHLDQVRTTAQIAEVLSNGVEEVKRLSETPELVLPRRETLQLLTDLSYAMEGLSLRLDALERRDQD